MAETKRKNGDKTTGRKHYLTDDEIKQLNVLCVHYHLNLSEMVGRTIKYSFEEMKKQKAEINFKEQLNSLDFITSINEQVANLEKAILKIDTKILEISDRQTKHKTFFNDKDNEIIETTEKILRNLQKTKLIGSSFTDIAIPKKHNM